MNRDGIAIRIPRVADRPDLHRAVANARSTLLSRAARAHRRADTATDPDSPHAAALRGKAVGYKEAADLLDAILDVSR